MKKLAFALAIFPSLALAQGLPSGALPVSKGVGTSGWDPVGPCQVNESIVWTGAATPICRDAGISSDTIGFRLNAKTVNLNTTADTVFALTPPPGVPFTNVRFQFVVISNASASLTDAVCGLWSGPGKTGTTIIGTGAVGVVMSGLNGAGANSAGCMTAITVNNSATAYYNFQNLYWSCSTTQAATLDLTIAINILN